MTIEEGLALLRQEAPEKMVAIHADYMLPPITRQASNVPHTGFIAFIHVDKELLVTGSGDTCAAAVLQALVKLGARP